MLSRGTGQDMPGPERGDLFLTEDAVELSSCTSDLILHHRQQRLGVGQDDAILQELGAGRTAEGRLIRPSLIERCDLKALLDPVELTL